MERFRWPIQRGLWVCYSRLVKWFEFYFSIYTCNHVIISRDCSFFQCHLDFVQVHVEKIYHATVDGRIIYRVLYIPGGAGFLMISSINSIIVSLYVIFNASVASQVRPWNIYEPPMHWTNQRRNLKCWWRTTCAEAQCGRIGIWKDLSLWS